MLKYGKKSTSIRYELINRASKLEGENESINDKETNYISKKNPY